MVNCKTSYADVTVIIVGRLLNNLVGLLRKDVNCQEEVKIHGKEKT